MKTRLVELLEQFVAAHEEETSAAPNPNGMIEQEAKTETLEENDLVDQYLQALTPSQLDAEIRGLGLDFGFEEEELGLMIDYFTTALASRRSFEFLQALLNLFLKVHSEFISTSDTLAAKVQRLSQLHRGMWSQLHELFEHNLCIVNFFAKIL